MTNNYKLWIVISLIIVFAAGVTGGILFDNHILHKKPKKTERRRTSVHFPTLETMAQELNLTSEQQEKIREVFQQNEAEFKSLRKHMGERLASMRKQLITDIKSVLNEDQTQKFEAMIEKYLSQRKREMEKRSQHSKQSKSKKGEEK